MEVLLVAHTPDPERVVARSARVCYSFSPPQEISIEEARRLIKELIFRGHHSVLEHVSFTFLIKGLSRVTSHQLVRHRIASYSQQSQRYTDLTKASFVTPPLINENPKAAEVFQEVVKTTLEAYNKLVELGVPREDARFVLPQAVKTNLVFTANARELRHFFSLRLCNRAQWEIRELAFQMLKIVREIASSIFEEVGPPCLRGTCPEGERGCGHPWKKN
ncbi:MAG: FAD-dependent thymidylate synthase [Candidatus Atribacteria bacterium]|nr:FAD-dependent thymidylate synthase [Candidatus Atribacteria bacterium]MCD6349838.1 FAD-dependent thymidylate synthase [Candidatus Atribacteria bacterium]